MTANPFDTPDIWSSVADGYADRTAAVSGPLATRALEFAALPAGATVVDIACGPGTLALRAAAVCARVHALDFSAAMIERLERDAREQRIDNVVAQVGDGQQLPYADNAFDAGFSLFGLIFFPDRARGFAELFRVLRPAAAVVVSSWAPPSESPLTTLTSAAIRAGHPETPAPEYDPASLSNPEVFEAELRHAGFADIQIHTEIVHLAYPSAAEFWRATERGSVLLSRLRQRLGEQEWSERSALMLDHVEQHYRPNQLLTTTAYFGVGRKPGLSGPAGIGYRG